MRNSWMRTTVASFIVSVAFAVPAPAQILQGFAGGSTFATFEADGDTVGWSFTHTTTGQQITHLGFWDNPGVAGPITLNHDVGIWDNAGTLLGQVTITPTSPLTGDFRYEPLLSAVVLNPGIEYVLGAFYSAANPTADGYQTGTTSQSLASGFTITNSRRDPSGPQTALVFPSVLGAGNGRFGPNALFSAVPEPSSMALVGIGLLAGAWRLRKRRQQAA
jgi:hypothetical protein